MALTEQVVLDIQSAQRQITALESQLAQLSTPVNVPVSVSGSGDLEQVRRGLESADGSVEALNRELAETETELRSAGLAGRRAGDDLESGARRASTAFSGLSRTVVGIGSALLAAQGLRAFVGFASDAINEASELEQSVGALEAVFGALGSEVAAFGETADQSVGLAASEFNQLASLLGSQLQTFGFNVSDAADESQRLIGVASDLAATFGGPVSDAVEAISSLLRGEVNPIERYGVAMNQTLVNAKALELGLANTTAELSLQDQTMARLAILTEQTANAQGQFAREADTTAGRLERIRAGFSNFQAEVGEQLVPAFEALLDAVPAVMDAVEGLVPVVADFADQIASIDFASGIDGMRRFGTTASGVLQLLLEGDLAGATAAGFVNDFAESLKAGVDPVRAFAAVLEQFQGFRFDVAQGLDADEVRSVVDSLQGFADLPLSQLQTLLNYFRELGPSMDLSGEELDGILAGLQSMVDEGRRAVETDRWNAMADALNGTADAAAAAAPPMESLADALADLELPDLTAGVAEFDRIFSSLPSSLDAAGEAMRNEENEITSDFTSFLSDLESELESRRAFTDNLAILRAMGLDDLAATFEAEGLEAAGLLADAVANPAEAARAEAALDDFAQQQAESYAGVFRDTLAQALQAQSLDLTIPLNVIGAVQSLQLQGLDATSAVQVVGASGAGPNIGAGGGGFAVTQNFYTEPSPTVDTVRAGQNINALIGSALN